MITPDQGAPYLHNVVSILRHERQLQHGRGELLWTQMSTSTMFPVFVDCTPDGATDVTIDEGTFWRNNAERAGAVQQSKNNSQDSGNSG